MYIMRIGDEASFVGRVVFSSPNAESVGQWQPRVGTTLGIRRQKQMSTLNLRVVPTLGWN